jgi:hypothetical protein
MILFTIGSFVSELWQRSTVSGLGRILYVINV